MYLQVKLTVVLENNTQMILPPTVTKVPALLLLNRGHRVITGQQIKTHLIKQEQQINMQSTQMNGEPLAFSLMGGSGGFGNVLEWFMCIFMCFLAGVGHEVWLSVSLSFKSTQFVSGWQSANTFSGVCCLHAYVFLGWNLLS